MSKYINADDAIERLIVHHAMVKEKRNADYDYIDTYNGMLLGIKDAQKIIADMPAADAVEIKHGEWIIEDSKFEPWDTYICPFCNAAFGYKINFCGNCGADMRERKGAKDNG